MCRATPILLCLASATILLVSPGAAANDLDGDLFEERKLGVRFSVPEGWQLSRQTGYPSLLAFIQRGDARITLAFTRLSRRQKLIQVLADNNRALEALGFELKPAQRLTRFGRRLWRSVAEIKGPKADLRRNHQLYINAGQLVYILTLSASSASERRTLADLDYVLETLKTKRWALPQEGLVRERSRRKSARPPTTNQAEGKELGPELGGDLGGDELGTPPRPAPPRPTATPSPGDRDVSDRAHRRSTPRPTATRPAATQPATTRPVTRAAPSRPSRAAPRKSTPAPSATSAPRR